MLVHLMLSQRSLMLSFFLSILFFYFFLLCRSYFHHSVFQIICPFLASVTLLSISSSVLFISVHSFFSSSRSLVNVFHLFSIHIPNSWIIFIFIILDSSSEMLAILTSFSYFSGDLSCTFIWAISLCLFIVISFL